MAIYQFYLAVIPEKGMLEYFGEIPGKLDIDFQKRTNDFLEKTNANEKDYVEKVMHKCWELTKHYPDNIIAEIDKELDRATWGNDNGSNNWKTETNEIDNDAYLLTNVEFNEIREFTFRADLRDRKMTFLRKMINLSKNNHFLLMDINGNLVNPNIKEVLRLIQKSNSFKVVENPLGFLKDLEDGKI